ADLRKVANLKRSTLLRRTSLATGTCFATESIRCSQTCTGLETAQEEKEKVRANCERVAFIPILIEKCAETLSTDVVKEFRDPCGYLLNYSSILGLIHDCLGSNQSLWHKVECSTQRVNATLRLPHLSISTSHTLTLNTFVDSHRQQINIYVFACHGNEDGKHFLCP
ncbi:hypothetical protein KI387_020409, partial [Taxus chinensis]